MYEEQMDLLQNPRLEVITGKERLQLGVFNFATAKDENACHFGQTSSQASG